MINTMPAVRKLKVTAIKDAMTGNISRAIDALQSWASSNMGSASKEELCHIILTEAFIRYLNGQDNECLKIFEISLQPILNDLSDNLLYTVEDNEIFVAHQNLKPGSLIKYYALQDREKLGMFKGPPWRALLSAEESAQKNKHYDAYPIFWRNFVDAFKSGNWTWQQDACKHLSKECLTLSYFAKSSYYAIIACSEEMAEASGNAFHNCRNRNEIDFVLDFICTSCIPIRLAATACKMLNALADAIPDDKIEMVVLWIIPLCAADPNSMIRPEFALFTNSWEALKKMVWRLDQKTAERVLSVAINHSFWKKGIPARKYIVEAIYPLVSRLSQADIIALCNAIMPIATSYKSDRDYLEVINLLCEIVKQVPSMKENVGSALYPTTQDKISIYLIQASKVFGREELGKERALSLYAKVIESFTFMIQRVPKDTAVSQTYDSFGSIAKVNGGNDKTVVQMYSGRILNALVGLRTSLQSAQIENLIDCIINLLIEPENLLGNKIVLIEELSGLSDVMPDKFAEKAIRALLPLGNGEITESTISMPYSEAQDPMNPYKMNDTSPYDLQGMAIYCLSKISKNHPALLNIEINHVLAECLASINENVRMFAYAAVSRIPSQSEELLSCLIVGTRDGNEKAASSAMGAIIGKNALELSDINWKLLALSLSLHAYSDSPQLRRLSAALIAKNMSKFPSIIELQVKELREILEVDPCYSVRYALHHPEAYLEVFK